MYKNILSGLFLNRLFLCIFCCGGALVLIYLTNLHVSLKSIYVQSRLSSKTLSIHERKSIDTGKTFHYRNVTSLNRGNPQLLPDQKNEDGLKHFQEFQKVSTTEEFNNDTQEKEWYYRKGTKFPTVSEGNPQLFPDENPGDRILEQLMYVPKQYRDSPKKRILAYNGLKKWQVSAGSDMFSKCPVNKCLLTEDKKMTMEADVIIYKNVFIPTGKPKPAKQIWVMFFLEPPYKTKFIKYPNVFNWTATYRHDSDLVVPYGRWNYYDSKVTQKIQTENYAANRTKKVAWFVTNCDSPNGRLAYALELRKYIKVDIYGKCGSLKCPRTNESVCFDILKHDYKFYLAFENSNCLDYITEKYYRNSLQYGVLPIVMGARPEDYERNVPKNSYIHVDDFGSPRDLANYLHQLDTDDELYNSYFKWKGTGEFINAHFWCRLCALLHSPYKNRHYEDINKWWRGPGVCRY